MRRCLIALWLLAVCYIGGCSFMDSMAGVIRDEQGNVIGTSPTSPADTAVGFLGMFGPWGAGAAAVARWGLVEYRHRALVKAGKKDANRDGIEDPPAAPPSGQA